MQKHPEAQGGSPGWRHRKSQQPAFRQKKPRQFLRWVLAKSRNSRQNRQPVAVRFPAPLLFNYSPLIPRAGRVTSFGGFLRRRRVNINIFVADFRQFNSFRTFPASIIPWRHPLPLPPAPLARFICDVRRAAQQISAFQTGFTAIIRRSSCSLVRSRRGRSIGIGSLFFLFLIWLFIFKRVAD